MRIDPNVYVYDRMPRRKTVPRERTSSEIEFSELPHSSNASTRRATPWSDEPFTPFVLENEESGVTLINRRKRSRSSGKKGGYKYKKTTRRRRR